MWSPSLKRARGSKGGQVEQVCRDLGCREHVGPVNSARGALDGSSAPGSVDSSGLPRSTRVKLCEQEYLRLVEMRPLDGFESAEATVEQEQARAPIPSGEPGFARRGTSRGELPGCFAPSARPHLPTRQPAHPNRQLFSHRKSAFPVAFPRAPPAPDRVLNCPVQPAPCRGDSIALAAAAGDPALPSKYTYTFRSSCTTSE